jgi:uncharacterized protein (DUF427 family)
MKAIWNGTVIAEGDDTVMVEGNHYFPADSVKQKYLKGSDNHTMCPWKGQASYYHVEIEGRRNADAAWYYPDAKDAAKQIEGRVAFWKSIEVVQ